MDSLQEQQCHSCRKVHDKIRHYHMRSGKKTEGNGILMYILKLVKKVVNDFLFPNSLYEKCKTKQFTRVICNVRNSLEKYALGRIWFMCGGMLSEKIILVGCYGSCNLSCSIHVSEGPM